MPVGRVAPTGRCYVVYSDVFIVLLLSVISGKFPPGFRCFCFEYFEFVYKLIQQTINTYSSRSYITLDKKSTSSGIAKPYAR